MSESVHGCLHVAVFYVGCQIASRGLVAGFCSPDLADCSSCRQIASRGRMWPDSLGLSCSSNLTNGHPSFVSAVGSHDEYLQRKFF